MIAPLLLAAAAAFADQPPKTLPEAQAQARQALDGAAPRGLAPLRRDLDTLADALDAADEEGGPAGEEEKDLQEVAREGRETAAALRPKLDPRLGPALDVLDRFYAELPAKTYAEPWGQELQRIVAEQLRWTGARAKTPEEAGAMLAAALRLPARLPIDADVQDQALWPVEIPLAKFKKLDPIRVFLLKHRLRHPPRYAATTAARIIDGRHDVEAGVVIEGKVTGVSGAFDQDYCFNIGNLHVELTPEWRLLHPHIYKPTVGDKVRLKGWTYYDYFHKAEHEYRPDDPVLGDSRYTLWEIHPVQDIQRLP